MIKRKTQNPVFVALVAILVSLLFTCIPLDPPDDYDEYEDIYTDVDYSPDGSSVTIYLDGSAPVRQSRALSRDLAVFGHDFFEVAFYHQNSGTMARAVWERGHAAGVSGVARDINYSRTYSSGTTIPAGEGAAILFVGKKSDRTLLALGRLTHVDGLPVTQITANSKTVTFSIAALRAGVSEAPGFSSFKTDALGPGGQNSFANINTARTEILNVTIGRNPFPLFRMDENLVTGQYVHAQYDFEVNTGVGDFNTYYRSAIIKKDALEVVYPQEPELRIPRYPRGGSNAEEGFPNEWGNKWETSQNSIVNKLPVDKSTIVTPLQNIGVNNPVSNTVLNQPVPNPMYFTIGPTTSPATDAEGHVFAFSFQIPVYPISNNDGRASGFSWYLRPGYDSYLYDLDDGMSGPGGAMLMGTGKFVESVSYSLFIRKVPDKTRYNGTGSNPWQFDLTGMVIYLRLGNQNIAMQNILLTDPDLYFVIQNASGVTVIQQGDNIQALLAANAVDGRVKVLLRYYGSPVDKNGTPPFIGNPLQPNPGYNGTNPFTGEFDIFYFNTTGINFNSPVRNRFVIVNQQDFLDFQNNVMNRPQDYPDNTFVLVFMKNYNLGALTLTRAAPIFVIVMAGEPDVIIGKTAATGSVFNDNGLGNQYYFGVWPFDVILTVDGMGLGTYPYILNAGGPWEDVTFTNGVPNTTTAAPAGNYISGGAGALYPVGVTLVNPTRLRPGYTP